MSLINRIKGVFVALAISVIGASSASAVTVSFNEFTDGNIDGLTFSGVTDGTITFVVFGDRDNTFDLSVAGTRTITATITNFVIGPFATPSVGALDLGLGGGAYDLAATDPTTITRIITDTEGLVSITGDNDTAGGATVYTLEIADISAPAIPLPAGAVLLLGGLGVFGAVRARKSLA